MPGWQRWYAARRHDRFELVSVAVDYRGVEAARPFVETAAATYSTVVDAEGRLADLFGFKVVPNGVLVDREGTVRWAKFGGFSIEHAADVAVVDRFAAGDDSGPSPEHQPPYQLGPLERDLVAAKLRLGHLLHHVGRRGDAVAVWREALRLDPENFTIRKQIWAADHPERFAPTIDFAWQQRQLAEEREREIAEGVCGPDGCPIPWPEDRGSAAAP